MQEQILKKSYKILILAIIIFILGLTFFFLRAKDIFKTKSNYQVIPLSPGFTNVLEGESIDLKKLPPPKEFSHFIFNGFNKQLKIKGECHDAFLTALLFEDGVDYREHPQLAKFNSAFSCKKGEVFETVINLSDISLKPGKYYYIIADQGNEGTWYHPR
jgi:hypothetical protein